MAKKKLLVEKRNILNEVRSNDMTLQEIRFLSIYLAKINPRQPEETRLVRFSLRDFATMMDIKGNLDISYIGKITEKLLQRIVRTPTPAGGRILFQLFKKCIIDQDKDTLEWFVEINAHDEALPLMFNIRNEYLTYELWNVLQLKSVNQFRMYEILKQYEKLGQRILTIEELKILLGIEKNEYSLWQNFKKDVIEVCQKALKEYTDIKFEWEISKRGQRGKILEIRFIISKNDEYRDVLNLDMYLKNYAYNEYQEILYNKPIQQNLPEMNETTSNDNFPEKEQPLLPKCEPQKQNQTKKALEIKPLEKITSKDIEYAKQHKLWKYASMIALNRNAHSPVPYATRVILTWDILGYKNRNDIIRGGEIKGQVSSYDLDLLDC
jgi:hypothetical protein